MNIKVKKLDGTILSIKVPRVINYTEATNKLSKRHVQTIDDFRKFLIRVLTEFGISLPQNNDRMMQPLWVGPRDPNSYYLEIYSSEEEASLMMKITVSGSLDFKFELCEYYSSTEKRKAAHRYEVKSDTSPNPEIEAMFFTEDTWISFNEFLHYVGAIAKFFKAEMETMPISG